MHFITQLATSLAFGAAAFFYSASATPAPHPPPTLHPRSQCPGICNMIYLPVKCAFNNGDNLIFGNECQARAYACEHGLRIIGCVPRGTSASAPSAAV